MIEINNIEKSFGQKNVLDKLSLKIKEHDIYGLLGPNGSGKTTTINILCNLLDADRGEIRINQQPVSSNTRRDLGIVPQEIAVYQDLTCRENMAFFGRLYGLSRQEIAKKSEELVSMFNLDEYLYTNVSELSGGWLRRLNIAVALIHSPSVLILDEPTAGLDIEARFDLWKLINDLKGSGVTILLTTHHLEEAERLCSRIGIIQNGRIAVEGTIEKLRNLVPAKQLTFIESEEEEQLCRTAESLDWEHRHYGGRLTFLLPKRFTIQELVNKFDGVGLTSISLQEVGLEHVYLEVTQN